MNYWNGKKILVTGGAGFIGHRLVIKLVEQGARVTVIDDLSKGNKKNLAAIAQKVELRRDSLLDRNIAKGLLVDCDVCFHLAARIGGIGYFHKTPASSLRDNSRMNFNLWDAAIDSGCKMVCLSSSMVFERASEFPTPEKAVYSSAPPMTGYGFSKLVAEYIARTYSEEFDVKYLIVRPFNAYGPGEAPGDYVGYAHVIPDLIKKTLSDQYPLEILGSGKQTRSYTYVDDVADAIIYVAERFENEDFNIGTGVETSVVDLAIKIWNLCVRKEPFEVKFIPGFKYDVLRRVPDVTRIFEKGWRPKYTLEEGLRLNIEWLRQNLDSTP
ncbi:MAG: NAD-dependent epimerase/dehydratase family protein [Candidatus Bathyarchaeia archaeon]